jgi:hypothetical protein
MCLAFSAGISKMLEKSSEILLYAQYLYAQCHAARSAQFLQSHF